MPGPGTVHLHVPFTLCANLWRRFALPVKHRGLSDLRRGTDFQVAELELRIRDSRVLEIAATCAGGGGPDPREREDGVVAGGDRILAGTDGRERRKGFLVSGQPVEVGAELVAEEGAMGAGKWSEPESKSLCVDGEPGRQVALSFTSHLEAATFYRQAACSSRLRLRGCVIPNKPLPFSEPRYPFL